MKNSIEGKNMKRTLSAFLKNSIGVVQMEYVVLGAFAAVVIVVAVMALGANISGSSTVLTAGMTGNTVATDKISVKLELTTEDNLAQSSEYFMFMNDQAGLEDPDKTRMGGKEQAIGLKAGD